MSSGSLAEFLARLPSRRLVHLICCLRSLDFPDSGNEPYTPMNILVKVQHKGQMTIPRRVRSAVGLADGDMVEVRAVGRKIVITPQLVIDRSKFPTADDDYTP